MAKAQHYVLACNDCEVIGPALVIGATIQTKAERGRPAGPAAAGRRAWSAFFAGYTVEAVPLVDDTGDVTVTDVFHPGHGTHDLRLLTQGYDPVLPLPGWMPRPDHGPAAGGEERGHREQQLVACPDCRSVYLHGDRNRRAVVFETVDQGAKWFLFCRKCRNVWGEAATDRMVRAELSRSPLEEALWTLQRQGIQHEALDTGP